VLETTEHTVRYREDLERLSEDGLTSFRACIPWHRIESEKGRYDWGWTDGYLGAARELNLAPIADPLHHTSFPDWLTGGMADPAFGSSYLAFVEAFAIRYPWVQQYTVINEPFVTAWFCGHCGVWPPLGEGPSAFVPMLLAVARTICEVSAALTRLLPGCVFVHADSCERHTALDAASEAHAERGNALRFSVLDLILGRVDRAHPLWTYFAANGMTDAQAHWLQDNPARIDILGLDYYAHSELAWTQEGRASRHPVAGFAAIGLEYAERYGLPVMLSETNLRGSVADRMSWLRYMVAECTLLADALATRSLPFKGFCWYPYIDSTDWSSLVRTARRDIDPQGIYWLDEAFERNASELSSTYAALAQGRLPTAGIPAPGFDPATLDGRGVRNHLPRMPWLTGQGADCGSPSTRRE